MVAEHSWNTDDDYPAVLVFAFTQRIISDTSRCGYMSAKTLSYILRRRMADFNDFITWKSADDPKQSVEKTNISFDQNTAINPSPTFALISY